MDKLNNVIPVITDPLGSAWDQPSLEEILVDDTHAVMSQSALDKLAEYSFSTPSGVYEGKCWKINTNWRERGKDPKWFLAWFGPHETPNFVSNNYREILVVQ